jgi:N-acetylglucosamine-6-sulfatase
MAIRRRGFIGSALAGAAAAFGGQTTNSGLDLKRTPGAKPRNIIFILTDDHRYDAFGFLKGQPWLETPRLDSLARDGVHFKNAFVTTSLCSPSRASILTGRYAHQHGIVDNNTAIPRGTRFFPQYLQRAGYKTAFIGKWHMGGASDAPQPGFDRWVSFRGQGTYLPDRNGLNVDGQRVPQKGYITSELTDYALDWLRQRKKGEPYFMYLSHKAVHADFIPPDKYKGRYKDREFVYPKSMGKPDDRAQHRPMWTKNQRNSWHGVEYPYHSDLNIGEYYKRYAETLGGVDDSTGLLLDELRNRGELDSTLIVYMGDNGFAFGEHGLIDKRTAYEESIRVPLLARCPELFQRGQTVGNVVANIDLMPTFLDAAGLQAPPECVGANWLPLTQGRPTEWRKEFLYEYYWERNFPQTPTTHAIRGDRYKFIRYHGVWDIDELYDLQDDPAEMRNLIFSPEHQAVAREMRARLFATLKDTGGMQMPIYPDSGGQSYLRKPDGSHASDFPDEFYLSPRRTPAQGD